MQPKFNAPPPPEARVKEPEDWWEVRGNRVIRHHRKPRQITFTPAGTGCPIDVSKLTAKRVTHAINVDTQVIQETVDEWRCTRPYYNPFENSDLPNSTWTGWTEFEIMEEQAGLPQEETRGGAKRGPEEVEAEEDRAVTAKTEDESGKPGVKRTAEEEGDEERTRREEERMRTSNQRAEEASGSGVKRKAEDEGNEERKRPGLP